MLSDLHVICYIVAVCSGWNAGGQLDWLWIQNVPDLTGKTVTKPVQCGAKHCCVLSTINGADSGSLSCWVNPDEDVGQADTSQLGSDIVDFTVGLDLTCALSASGTVTCIGVEYLDWFLVWIQKRTNWIGSFQISSIFNPSSVRLTHGCSNPFHFCLYEDGSNLLIQCMYSNLHLCVLYEQWFDH